MIILRASARRPGHVSGTVETTVDSGSDDGRGPETAKAQVNGSVDLRFSGAPPGTRTPNPLVKSQLLCQLS
jgi:hypothetical protein